jgi:prevent-host-death family protein
MEIYITLSDLSQNFEEYLRRVRDEDQRFIIQDDLGNDLAVLVPSKVVDVIEKLSKSIKIVVE